MPILLTFDGGQGQSPTSSLRGISSEEVCILLTFGGTIDMLKLHCGGPEGLCPFPL